MSLREWYEMQENLRNNPQPITSSDYKKFLSALKGAAVELNEDIKNNNLSSAAEICERINSLWDTLDEKAKAEAKRKIKNDNWWRFLNLSQSLGPTKKKCDSLRTQGARKEAVLHGRGRG